MEIMNCPWDSFAQRTVRFCENQLCGYIVEPANAWSNIGFLIVAILIYRQERKLNFFAITAAYLFFGSTAFHATGTFWGEALDLSAMFLISGTLLTLNIKRQWPNLSVAAGRFVFWGLFGFSILLLMIFKPLGIAIFTVQTISYVLLELKLSKTNPPAIGYGFFKQGLLFFGLAFTFWTLDITGIMCWPDNHVFTGHSAWHLLTAAALYYFYKFYTGQVKSAE